VERTTGNPASVRFDHTALSLFSLVMLGAVVAVPLFGYYVGYTWVDWTMAVLLYFASGLGITVGYHRLISHRSLQALGQGGFVDRRRMGIGEFRV